MSNSPYNNRYHWQQGPPPYYPGFINHHIMDPNYRRPFAGPHPDWNNTYHYRRSHGRGRHHRNFHDYCGYDHEEYICFICKDQLQNCEDHGIHLCDGGKEKKEEFVYTVEKENIDAKLGNFVCIVYLTQGSLNIECLGKMYFSLSVNCDFKGFVQSDLNILIIPSFHVLFNHILSYIFILNHPVFFFLQENWFILYYKGFLICTILQNFFFTLE